MLVEPNMEGLGYERIKRVHGSTYKDNSVIVVCPMRGIEKHTEDEVCKGGDHRYCRVPMVHQKAFESWRNMLWHPNQKHYWHEVVGHEVGHAYNTAIAEFLAHPELSKWTYIASIEDDMIIPPDAIIRLVECIEETGADAVSGMYFTKGEGFNMPMAYGDPKKFRDTGVLEFAPVDVSKFLENGQAVEVNGIAQGISLYRTKLFREIPAPWFVTVSDIDPATGGAKTMTQDLEFCAKARRAGKRFYVDCRVRAGHIDINNNTVY